jgi:N-acetyl-gamma-glutamyl-phosphate reductase
MPANSQVAVAGASGYAGGELLRLLEAHPRYTVGPVMANQAAGRSIGEVHPHLVTLAERTFDATDAGALGTADLVMLALPHGQSAALVAELDPAQPVLDLGADFRLVDPEQWAAFYPGEHAGTWTYGLPELPGARAQIASSHRVANPGCYVTAVTLALAPLFDAGLVEPDDVVVTAASGTSGAGRGAAPHLLASEVMGAMSAYKVGGRHQHIPEIQQNLERVAGTPVRVLFTPMLAPMPRGILAVASARLADPAATDATLHDALAKAYDPEPFVHVLPSDRWPTTAATLGSNSTHLQAAVDPGARRAVVVAALDNLGKGAAGQAVQNANLMLGLDETAGLPVQGVAP